MLCERRAVRCQVSWTPDRASVHRQPGRGWRSRPVLARCSGLPPRALFLSRLWRKVHCSIGRKKRKKMKAGASDFFQVTQIIHRRIVTNVYPLGPHE